MSKTRDRHGSPSRGCFPGAGWSVFIFALLVVLALPMLRLLVSQAAGDSAVRSGSVTHATTTQGTARQSATPTKGTTPQPTSTAEMEQWQVVLAAARKQIGGQYAQYGDTPETGFSCVGLVHWSFAQAGINVPESEEGLADNFPHVVGATPSGTALLPGDILIFHDTGLPGLSHAAIYTGAGKMVSADSPEVGIREDVVNSPFWVAHWSLAVRVPGLTAPAPTAGS